MKYLVIVLFLAGCGSSNGYVAPANPYGYMPTCHAPIVGGVCTGPMF